MSQTTTTTRAEVKSPFTRKARIGYNFLSVRGDEPAFVKITGIQELTNKQGETNLFWDATNLQTGETGMIYLDGGLKGQCAAKGGPKNMVGLCLEIRHKGLVETVIDGETVEVNAYDIYELDPM